MKNKPAFRLVRTGTPAAWILAAATAALLGVPSASAADIYWDGTGTGWDSVGAWDALVDGTGGDPSSVPGAADIADFSISTLSSAQTVNLNGNQSALGLVFLGTNTATTALQGGDANHSLTIGANGITVSSLAGAVTIGSATAGQNVAITLGGAQAWTNNSANGLTIQNTVSNGGSLLTVGGTGNTTINGALSGTGGLTKADGGTLTLLGTPIYTGNTDVTGGTLYLRSDTFAPNGALFSMGNLTVEAGATLRGERSNMAGSLTLNGGTWNENNGFGGSWTGGVTLGATSTITGGYAQSIFGVVSGAGGITKTGAGTLTLSGADTYLGTTTISAGTLQLGNGAVGRNGSVVSSIVDNATLALNNASALTLAGDISGSGVVNKLGAGTLTLSAANTYVGVTTVTAGVLSLGNANALPGGIDAAVGAGESALTLNGGVIGLTAASGDFLRAVGTGSGQVQWTATTGTGGFAAYGGDRAVNLGGAGDVLTWNTAGPFGSAGLILSNFDSDSKITFQNPIDFNGSVRTVTVANGSAAVDAELSGVLSGAAGGINKAGAGTLLLSAANTYGGATTIGQGILLLGAAGDGTNSPLGTTAGNTTVSATGAALDVGGITLSTPEPLTLNGTGLSNMGALTNSGAAATFSGPVTLASAASIGSTSGTLTLTGGISGAFGLTFAGTGNTTISNTPLNANVSVITKIGSGNLTFDVNSNLVTAPIAVNAGTFTIKTGVLGSVATTVSVTSAATNSTNVTLASATLPQGFGLGSSLLGQEVIGIQGSTISLSGNASTAISTATASAFTGGLEALSGSIVNLTSTSANRLGGRGLYIAGATINDSGAAAETTGNVAFGPGESVINNTSGATLALGTAQPSRIFGATALFKGGSTINLGATPTFTGQTGANGANTKGILPWAIFDAGSGTGSSFATTDTAGTTVRALAGAEGANSLTTNVNAVLTSNPAATNSVSVNSLTFNAGSSAVSINTPSLSAPSVQTLTLGSGGLLSNVATSSISGGVLTSGGNVLYVFTPGASASANVLTLPGTVTSTGGFVKAGAGTVKLTSVSGAYSGFSANSISGANGGTGHNGAFMINEGVVQIGAGNALSNINTATNNNDGPSITLTGSGTLDLNGNTQFVGALMSQVFDVNHGNAVTGGGGGIITSTNGSQSGNIISLSGNPGGGGPFYFGGSITGANVGFARSGQAANAWGQIMAGANTYGGPTLLNGGGNNTSLSLILKDSGTLSGTSQIDINYVGLSLDNTGLSDNSNRVNNSAAVNLRGGYFFLLGRAQTISTETLGAVTAAQGNSTITVTPTNTGVNAAELTLTSLGRSTGATLNVTAGSGTLGQLGFANNPRVFVTGALSGNVAPIGAANNQIIPGVVVSNGDLASYNSITGIGAVGQTNFPAYASGTLNVAATTANFNGSGTVASGGQTLNALKPNGAITFANSGDVLTLTSGMVASANQSFGTVAVPGGLTSSTSELILHTAGNNMTLNSVVSGSNKLVLAGGGTYTLTANNLQTGGVTVNGGTLALTNSGLVTPQVVPIPNASTPADGLILNAATVNLTNSPGQIGSANIVTLNSNSTLNLFGNNTLAGLVLNNIGSNGAGNPVVNTTPSAFGATTNSTGITLTLTGGITETSNQIGGSPATINGRVNLPSSAVLSVGAATFNGMLMNPLQADLIVTGLTGGGGIITKSDTGTLQFNQQTTITGSLDVTGGGLQIGAAGAGARLADVILENGTRINLNNLAGTFGSLAAPGTGLVTNTSTTAQTLTVGFSNASTTFAGSFIRFNDATVNEINLQKIGGGTMTFTGNTSTASGALTLNSTGGGGVSFKDNGINNFVQSAIVVNSGSALTLDDTGSVSLTNRLTNAGVTLAGGAFVSSAAVAGSTESTTGALTLNSGESAVALNQGGTSNVTTFGSLTVGAGGTGTFSGTNLGTAANKLAFTSAPSLTNHILPRYAVGGDFATYNENGLGTANTNGLQAISASAYSIPVDINTAVSANNVKIDATVATRNLNAARTINSLNITDNNVTIGSSGALLPTAGLTLNSGAVMVNGTGETISTPVLALSAEGIFRVNGAGTLNLNSRLTGSSGLTKTGTGNMTLSKPQEYTGTTTINQGTLTLAGGKNTLLATLPAATVNATPGVSNLSVNGGTLDLNGNSQLVGTITSSNTLAGGGGTITNTSSTSATLTSLSGGSTFGGKITGNLNFTLNGSNSTGYVTNALTLTDQQSYTGATVIRDGRLVLQNNASLYSGVADLTNASVQLNFGSILFDNSGLNPSATPPTRIPSTVPFTLSSGVIQVNAAASADNSISLGTVTVDRGLSVISQTTGNASPTGLTLANGSGSTNFLTINNLQNSANGGVVNLMQYSNAFGAYTANLTQTLVINNINGVPLTSGTMLPAWAALTASTNSGSNTQGLGDFATLSSTGFGIVGYGDTALGGVGYASSLASGNVASVAATTLGAGTTLVKGLKSSATITIGANNILNIEGTTSGGTISAGLIGGTVGTTNVGTLTAGGSASTGTVDLYAYNTAALNSVIADNPNGAKVRLILANINNSTTISGNNTYTGGTILMDGREGQFGATLGGTGVIIPNGGLTMYSDLNGNSKGITTTAAGQIGSGNDVNLVGATVFLTMAAGTTNTLSSINFDNNGNGNGGNTNPFVNTATELILTKTTANGSAITSSNNNINAIPNIQGTKLTVQDGATITTSGEAPIDLIVAAQLATSGTSTPLHKNGTGSLVLTFANTFANGFNLDAGSLIFSASSAGGGTAGAAPSTSQIGTGALTLGDGTAIMGSAAVSIGNVVNVANDAGFTFGTLDATNARATATNNLTLTNTVTLGSGAHTINVNGLNMTGTISGQLTGGTNLTKAGPGTLVLNNAANNFGGSVTINGGTLQQNVAGSIPSSQIMAVAAGAAFNMNGISQSLDSLNGAGSVINPGASATLTISGTNDGAFSGAIAANTAANLSLIKDGANTQVLSGLNPYGGSTTVNNGTLLINGANTGSGTISVAAGATIGGTGSIAGALNVSGAVSPGGATIGTLTSGAVTFANNSTYNYQVNSGVAASAGADLHIVNGALSLGSQVALNLANLGSGTFAAGTVFSLFNYAAGLWNSGVLTYNSVALAEDSTFTFAGKTWTIDYDATTKGANVAGAQSGSYVNISTAAAADPFTAWIQTPAFAIPADKQGPSDDPDGDGATNLEEFAFGGNPADSSTKGLVFGIQADSNDAGTAKEMILTIAVRNGVTFSTPGNPAVSDATVDGLNYAIQGSTDLTNWTATVTPVQLINPGLPTLPAGYQYVSFSLNGSDGLPGKGFLRAQVVRP